MFSSVRSARHLFGFLALGVLAACGGGRAGSSVTPPLGTSQAAKSHVKTLSSTTASAAQALFVANSGNNTVTEYALPYVAGTPPMTTINLPPSLTNGSIPNGLAVDASGHLFVLMINSTTDASTITEYAPPYTGTPTSISAVGNTATAIAMNTVGDLFVMNQAGCGGPGPSSTCPKVYTIMEYAPPYTNPPIATITGGGNETNQGIYQDSFVMDTAGNIFAFQEIKGAFNQLAGFQPPYTGTPIYYFGLYSTISQNYPGRQVLAVDASDDLFFNNGTLAALNEYKPPYSGTPTSIGDSSPVAAAVDAANNLFVANGSPTNSVTEYAPTAYTAASSIISNGVSAPTSLAIGSAPSPSPTLTLTKATTTDTKSVTVNYNISQNGLQSVQFSIYRGGSTIVQNPTAGTQIGNLQTISSTTQDASGNPALQQGAHALKLSSVLNLTPDTSNEYIVVVATYNGQTSTTYFRKWMLAALAHGFDREALKAHLFPTLYTLGWIGGYALDPWETEMDNSLQGNDGYDHVIPFNWMTTSALAQPGLAQQAGANLAIDVQTYATTTQQQHPGDVVDMHFIGHSRGTVVVTQALQKLAVLRTSTLQGSYVELTLLDPHPANNRYGLPDGNWGSATTVPGLVMQAAYIAATAYFQGVADDPQVIIPAWVNHTDVWWQHTKADLLAGEQYSEDIQNLWGMVNQGPGGTIVNFGAPIPPNNIKELTADQGPGGTIINIIPGLSTSPSGVVGHSEVPYVYLQQVVNPGNLRAPQF